MDFFRLLFDHFFEVIVFLFLFGGSIGTAVRWFIRRSFEHQERMQEKKNEELRLKIQLEQTKNARLGLQHGEESSHPLPKDAPWHDQVQSTYDMGYQQQIQQH